jgi:hypothetical protein
MECRYPLGKKFHGGENMAGPVMFFTVSPGTLGTDESSLLTDVELY